MSNHPGRSPAVKAKPSTPISNTKRFARARDERPFPPLRRTGGGRDGRSWSALERQALLEQIDELSAANTALADSLALCKPEFERERNELADANRRLRVDLTNAEEDCNMLEEQCEKLQADGRELYSKYTFKSERMKILAKQVDELERRQIAEADERLRYTHTRALAHGRTHARTHARTLAHTQAGKDDRVAPRGDAGQGRADRRAARHSRSQ